MKRIAVNHAGFTGDLVYCIPMLSELKEATNIGMSFHIQTNVKSNLMFDHPNGNVRMTQKAADFLIPLLMHLNLFDEITCGDDIPDAGADDILLDLSKVYNQRINYMAGNIQSWPYSVIGMHLPMDLAKPRIIVDSDYSLKDRIIIICSNRYNNVFIDYSVLKERADKFVFIGMNDEYEEFTKKYFKIDRFIITDALHFAKVLCGSLGCIANQSGLFSIAELMKVRRILVTSEFINLNNHVIPGPVNVHPQGGWLEIVSTQSRLLNAIDNLLRS